MNTTKLSTFCLQVFHNKNAFGPTRDLPPEFVWAACVTIDAPVGIDPAELCEIAYAATNSVDHPWFDLPESEKERIKQPVNGTCVIDVHAVRPTPIRSTSVGDRIKITGRNALSRQVWEVATCGFERVQERS